MDTADRKAFEEFYVGTVRKVTAQVYSMLGDMAETEDAVAEAYMRAWQRWRQVSQANDPAAWVRTVAYRQKVSAWRKFRTRNASHVRHGPPQEVPEPTADRIDVVSALRTLPEAQRRAVVLHYFAGLSIDEIAAETSAPAGTVKARLSRGRTALSKLLTDQPLPTPEVVKNV